MTDISHQYGSDLVLGANGDLLSVSNDAETQQRVLRRLLTNQGDYIWHITYGAGLGALVGTPAYATAINAATRSQIFAETSVAQSPEPQVSTVVGTDGTVVLNISYSDAATGVTSLLKFPIGQ